MGLISYLSGLYHKIRDYDSLQQNYVLLSDNNQKLAQDYCDLRQKAGEMVDLARKNLDKCERLCQESKRDKQTILAQARLNRPTTGELELWTLGERTRISSLEDEVTKLRGNMKYLNRELVGCVSKIFSNEMELLVAKNPEFDSIPFYYNGVGRNPPIYTKAFLDMFSTNLRVSEERLKDLTLVDLVDYVEEQKRKELGLAFFRGKKLKKYEFMTAGENPKRLFIGRSYPVFHRHFKRGEIPIGLGLFFIDPDNKVKDEEGQKVQLRTIKRFVSKLLHTVDNTTKELYVFSKKVREDKIPELTDDYIPVG